MAARKNGFDRPYHPLQVTSWVLFVVFGATAYPFFLAFQVVWLRVVVGVVREHCASGRCQTEAGDWRGAATVCARPPV